MSLPMDVQLEEAELDLTVATKLDHRVRPPLDALRKAASVLAAAENPGILAGSRVVESDAVAELVRIAEQLGAPAFSESATTHGRLGFPADHPLYGQSLPLWSPEVRKRLAEFDVLLVVGMDLLGSTFITSRREPYRNMCVWCIWMKTPGRSARIIQWKSA